jgi:hypothetical protein
MNERHRKNFFTFINEYRVKEVIERFNDSRFNNYTILAIAKVFGKKWDLSAGQQIIKWGRADFTNPTSKFNPPELCFPFPGQGGYGPWKSAFCFCLASFTIF